MRILVVGNESSLLECRQKFGDRHVYVLESGNELETHLNKSDVVFDFQIDKRPFQVYDTLIEGTVFLNTAKTSLKHLSGHIDQRSARNTFGFAGLPTFLNRPILEVSSLDENHLEKLKQVCQQLGTAFQVVSNKVGLVTPRVICMIINEAYFTFEEGTASREDIDLAMKLGTNYPWGPFEWSQRIGLKNIYELLEAVYQDTGDERYRICPLLKKEYLQS